MRIFPLIGNHLNNSSIFKKLLLSYVTLCIAPVLTLTIIFYTQARHNVEQASTEFMQMFVSQLNTTINTYLTEVDNITRTILTNYDIIDYLDKPVSSYSPSQLIHYNLLLQSEFSKLTTELPYVQGVMLVSTEEKTYTNGLVPQPLDNVPIVNQSWFQEAQGANGKLIISPSYAQIYLSSGTPANLFSAGRLMKDIEGRPVGVLLLHLSPSDLISYDEKMNTVRKQYHPRIMMTTSKGQLIYDSGQSHLGLASADTTYYDLEDNLVVTEQSEVTGVRTTVIIPKAALTQNITLLRNIILWLTLGTVLFVILVAFILSYQITKPIHRLIKSMNHVENDYYLQIPDPLRSDEIGQMTKTYNTMIRRIKHLIEEVHVAELKQNDARFLALQNQINPHWLYNTLESIRMKAYMNNAPEVATMVKTMGRLFQLALAKDRKTNTIQDEIEYIQTYVALQNIRFDDRFHLNIEIEEQWMQHPILKLSIQPLVENSIIHGFRDPFRHYTVTISLAVASDSLRIRVTDNGDGMSEERRSEIQTALDQVDLSSKDSLGLKNIDERLKLHYGASYGIAIEESIPGMSTTVAMIIPRLPGGDVGVQGASD